MVMIGRNVTFQECVRTSRLHIQLLFIPQENDCLLLFMLLVTSRPPPFLPPHTQKETLSHTQSLYVTLFKYTALEQQGVAVKEKLERRVAELENKLAEQESSGDTAAEVRTRT